MFTSQLNAIVLNNRLLRLLSRSPNSIKMQKHNMNSNDRHVVIKIIHPLTSVDRFRAVTIHNDLFDYLNIRPSITPFQTNEGWNKNEQGISVCGSSEDWNVRHDQAGSTWHENKCLFTLFVFYTSFLRLSCYLHFECLLWTLTLVVCPYLLHSTLTCLWRTITLYSTTALAICAFECENRADRG